MKQRELIQALLKSITYKQWIIIVCYLIYAYYALEYSFCYTEKNISSHYKIESFILIFIFRLSFPFLYMLHLR